MEKLLDEIESYWSTRTEGYSEVNHKELAVYVKRCGIKLSEKQTETLFYSSEGWFSAVYLNLQIFLERGVLPDGGFGYLCGIYQGDD